MVTGGNRGIGFGIAKGLMLHGASVAICGRTTTELRDAQSELKKISDGSKCLAIACDVSKRSNLQEFVDKTIECFGGVDILIANAGGIPSGASAPDIPDDENIKQIMDLNFMSVLQLCQMVYPEFVKRGGGKIITIGSMYSFNGQNGKSL